MTFDPEPEEDPLAAEHSDPRDLAGQVLPENVRDDAPPENPSGG